MSRPRSARRSLRRLVLGIALAVAGGVTIVSGALLWALLGLPVDKPASERQMPTLLLEAANGEPLGRVGFLRVANVPLQEFPPVLIKAVLSTEDRRFYDNIGVDPVGILRAAFANRAVA
jgi:membrane peptidoglycan carboxypeptidase